MKTSAIGLNLIKKYEGLRLVAYKPVPTEKYWTIGYGHYGADVKQGMKITEAQATEYLKKDVASAEKTINEYSKTYNFNQNQFDALVSFCYNCGSGNVKTLTNNKKRSIAEISQKLLAYNKGGGKVLAGLTRRRNEEKSLFDKPVGASTNTNKTPTKTTTKKVKGVINTKSSNLNIRKGPGTNYPVVGSYKKGASIEILEKVNGWVRTKDGYVSSAYVKEV